VQFKHSEKMKSCFWRAVYRIHVFGNLLKWKWKVSNNRTVNCHQSDSPALQSRPTSQIALLFTEFPLKFQWRNVRHSPLDGRPCSIPSPLPTPLTYPPYTHCFTSSPVPPLGGWALTLSPLLPFPSRTIPSPLRPIFPFPVRSRSIIQLARGLGERCKFSGSEPRPPPHFCVIVSPRNASGDNNFGSLSSAEEVKLQVWWAACLIAYTLRKWCVMSHPGSRATDVLFTNDKYK